MKEQKLSRLFIAKDGKLSRMFMNHEEVEVSGITSFGREDKENVVFKTRHKRKGKS